MIKTLTFARVAMREVPVTTRGNRDLLERGAAYVVALVRDFCEQSQSKYLPWLVAGESSMVARTSAREDYKSIHNDSPVCSLTTHHVDHAQPTSWPLRWGGRQWGGTIE